VRLTSAIAAALALALGVAHASAYSATGKLRPILRPTETGLRGLNFVPRERVHLVAYGPSRVTRDVRADGLGRFAVRLADVSSCAGFSVTATGNDGSRATFKRPPGQCPALGGIP
jgi:hypothetical protein